MRVHHGLTCADTVVDAYVESIAFTALYHGHAHEVRIPKCLGDKIWSISFWDEQQVSLSHWKTISENFDFMEIQVEITPGRDTLDPGLCKAHMGQVKIAWLSHLK